VEYGYNCFGLLMEVSGSGSGSGSGSEYVYVGV
jgi:hypothetical protein